MGFKVNTKKFQKDLMQELENGIRCELSNARPAFDCPFCKTNISAKFGKSLCPVCQKEIDVICNIV